MHSDLESAQTSRSICVAVLAALAVFGWTVSGFAHPHGESSTPGASSEVDESRDGASQPSSRSSPARRRGLQIGWGLLASAAGQGAGFMGAHIAGNNCVDDSGWGNPCIGRAVRGYFIGSMTATPLATGLAVDLADDRALSTGSYLGSALGAGAGQFAGFFAGAGLAGALEPTGGSELLLATVSAAGATAGSLAGYELSTSLGRSDRTGSKDEKTASRGLRLRTASPWVETSREAAGVGVNVGGTF